MAHAQRGVEDRSLLLLDGHRSVASNGTRDYRYTVTVSADCREARKACIYLEEKSKHRGVPRE
jgi:hypothetical protein